MELIIDDTPKTDDQGLPTALEMIDGYMARAYQALGTIFEVTQAMARMSQDKPALMPSITNARTFSEAGFLFLQNSASGLVAAISQAQEEADNG